MPRYRRTTPAGSLQHVIARFIDREYRIVCEEERTGYLDRLGTAISASDWRLISYGVMSSHVHWSALAGAMAFERLVKGVHAGFAGWLNRRQGRLGPVFADRPKTVSVDIAATPRLIAYQHNNPVRAGVAQRAAESSWTSHRAYLGLEEAPSWLDVNLGLQLAGFGNDAAGRQQFDRFVVASSREPVDKALSGGDLRKAQRDARDQAECPVEIGYPSLVGGELAFPVTASLPPWRGSMSTIVDVVSDQTGIAALAIRGRSHRPQIVAARRLVVLVARLLGRTQRELGLELGISAEAISRLERRACQEAVEAARGIAKRLGDECTPRWNRATWVRQVG